MVGGEDMCTGLQSDSVAGSHALTSLGSVLLGLHSTLLTNPWSQGTRDIVHAEMLCVSSTASALTPTVLMVVWSQ